jgi:hypothetical protein
MTLSGGCNSEILIGKNMEGNDGGILGEDSEMCGMYQGKPCEICKGSQCPIPYLNLGPIDVAVYGMRNSQLQV